MLESASGGTRSLWIGTYPGPDGRDAGEGIWRVELDDETGELTSGERVVACASPSFLALHPRTGFLYAVDESDEGAVSAYAPAQGSGAGVLDHVWTGSSGGSAPCHLAVVDDAVWVSNYGSGTFATVRLSASGEPTGVVDEFAHSGSGPDLDRQTSPHVHSSALTPDGRFAWVADLGTDEVWRYELPPTTPTTPTTAAATDDAPPVRPHGIAVALAPASGPRHMAFHASGVAFVAGELDNSVSIVRIASDTGAGAVVGSVPACTTTSDVGSYPSHIALNASGTRLYVAVRGPDVIGTFAVHPSNDPEAPVTLEYLGDTSVGGQWPRHLAVLPAPEGDDSEPVDRIVVANQNSNTLVVLDIDSAGRGTQRSRMDFPVPPACVLPVS